MSLKEDLDELMQVINTKYRDQRRQLEKENRDLRAKFEQQLKGRDSEIASIRHELLASKKRTLELEKLVVDQDSLIQRMRAKLRAAFDTSSLNGSISEAAPSTTMASRHQQTVDKRDKCVETEEWDKLLEMELVKRIELYQALNRRDETGASERRSAIPTMNGSGAGDQNRSASFNGSRDQNRSATTLNGSGASRHHRSSRLEQQLRQSIDRSIGGGGNDSEFSHPSIIDHQQQPQQRQHSRLSSIFNSSEALANGNGNSLFAPPFSSSKMGDVRGSRSLILADGLADIGSRLQQSSALGGVRETSTPATSIWPAPTSVLGQSHGHQSLGSRPDLSIADNSLPFDDMLRDRQNTENLEAQEEQILARFTELESDMNALFPDGMDELENAEASAVHDDL